MAKKKSARITNGIRPRATLQPRVQTGINVDNTPPSDEPISPQLEAKAGLRVMGGSANTIIYVHGIANKPPAEILKCQWDQALVGYDLGERSRLAYWVNRSTYPIPYPGTCQSGDVTSIAEESLLGLGVRALGKTETPKELVAQIEGAPSKNERAWLESLAKEIQDRQPSDDELKAKLFKTRGYRAKLLPLPEGARKWLTRQFTRLLLQDVYEFFFVDARREVMRESMLSRLRTGGGPFVVIGHSQGSMIAYDVLCSKEAQKLKIPLFITIGSPLGLTEVQDQLKILTGQRGGLSVPPQVERWINVSDPLDPVSLDQTLFDDIKASAKTRVVDFIDRNPDSPRHPHSGTGYLKLDVVRQAVQRAVNVGQFQQIGSYTVARDLAGQMEKGTPQDRHPVLIELVESRPGSDRGNDLAGMKQKVLDWIQIKVQHGHPELTDDRLNLEKDLEKYVSLELTRSEVEQIAADLKIAQRAIHHVYRNATKKALLDESLAVVQAIPAHRGYDALGKKITWAVLDTGIDPNHPHFSEHDNIAATLDCSLRGGPHDHNDRPDVGLDGHGHGTHVAGIIAGQATFSTPKAKTISGVAPLARLVIYKVLRDDGTGSDSYILKALDDIARKNREAGSLVVHGINLSLGGPYDVTSFGCGYSPICKALRELWRQGVVVVIAAGNEGYLEIDTSEGEMGLNADLSIGDPANLEEAIAVGSVHKSKPHHYGISYFSSRGPTADGRAKPDLVAPGERILSARAGGKLQRNSKDQEGDLYVELSGTSMAAPHVSGVIAAFLSARPEFIGDPDAVKKRLMANCTDLARDRMHQGAGLPNLVKMLLNT